MKNNIFNNQRTGGTGFHVAIANSNAAATGWAAGASNYNLLYNAVPANLTQWLGFAAGNNLTFAGWQTTAVHDANGITANPLFTTATNQALLPASPAISAGVTAQVLHQILPIQPVTTLHQWVRMKTR